MKKQVKKAFTLVELIVVITILAILGTIAFISLQGYSQSARDSVRISDLSNISKGLELQLTKGGKVSMPDDKVDITASGTVISYQGYAGKQVLQNIGVHGGGKDPVDDNYYTYSANTSLSKYQIMGFLENEGEISMLNNKIFADYSTRFPVVKGDQLGILLASGSLVPVQETGTGVDIVNTNNDYKMYLNNERNNIISGSGTKLLLGFINGSEQGKLFAQFDSSLVLFYNMSSTLNIGGTNYIKDFSSYGNQGTCYNSGVIVSCLDSGTGPSIINGMNGKAMLFDGIDDTICINDNNSLDLINGFTFLLISKQTRTTTSPFPYYITKYGPYLLHGTPNTQNYYLNLSTNISGFSQTNNQPNTDINIWKNIIVIFDKNKSQIIIDGVFGNENILTSPPEQLNTNSSMLCIGGKFDVMNRQFPGIIDEVRIYNRALPENEIKTLYNVTK